MKFEKVKYCIHPGGVHSNTDGDLHYIGAAVLAQLYNLGPSEYVVHDKNDHTEYIHLYPRQDGDYRLPRSH